MAENYSIEIDEQDVVVRFSRETVDPDALSSFLDYLDLEIIRRRSQLSADEAFELANDVDRSVWDSVKNRVLE